MVPEKTWKLEALARLVFGILACVMAGSVVATAMRAWTKPTAHDWKFIVASSAAVSAFGATLASLRKPWILERFLPRVIICLFFLQIGLVCAMWSDNLVGHSTRILSVGQMLVSFLFFQGAGVVLVHFLLKEHETTWTQAFGLLEHWERALLLGLIVGSLFFPMANWLQAVWGRLLEYSPVQVSQELQPAVQTLKLATSLPYRVVLGLGTIVLVPFAEETLFRGILYSAIKSAGFPRLALWTTSLLFAAIHVQVNIFVPLLVLAITLALLYDYTGNLLAPIAAHATFNAIGFVTLYFQQSQP